jgi:hypothetical protein
MSTALAPKVTRRTSGASGVSGRTRNPGRLAIAVLCVVGGGLLFVSLYRSRGQQVPVLIVARDVAAGQSITDADLSVAEVSAPGVDVISATERAAIVGTGNGTGQVAQVALRKGSLLVQSQLGAAATGVDGTGLVVVTLPADAVPSGLRAETPVTVVVGPTTYAAVVHDVRIPGASASTSNYAVTVRMKVADAAVVAVAKDVRLVLLPATSAAVVATVTTVTA